VGPAPHAKNSGGALDCCNRSKRATLLAPAAARAFSELWGIADDPVLAKAHATVKRAYVLAAEEDENDACEDEMNALFEFLTTEPAICPTA
jgi:hypothetical protein